MNVKSAKFLLIILAISGFTILLSGRSESLPLIVENPKKFPKKRKPIKKIKPLSKKEKKRKSKILRIYRNLNTGTLSAQEKTSKGWRVTMHPSKVKLKNAKFKVNQTGRKKVLSSKQKNVHAVIEGELVDNKTPINGLAITYDPYKTSQFVLESGKKVFEAELVSVDEKGNIRAKGIA
jgi:hypothetical protein